MIVIWIIELFMNQMSILSQSIVNQSPYSAKSLQYTELQKQFDNFLQLPKVKVMFLPEKYYTLIKTLFQ